MSPGFDLSDYNTVAERLDEFRRLDPERLGRITTEIVELPVAFATNYVAVKATVYRPGEDVIAGTGLAWEQVPGKTPYTATSELMVCETSAVGRALVNALVADTKKGIASREEVRRAADKSDAGIVGRASPTRRESVAPSGGNSPSAQPPAGDKDLGGSSVTPSSEAGVSAGGEGEAPLAAPPASGTHTHNWVVAPRAGFEICKSCDVPARKVKK